MGSELGNETYIDIPLASLALSPPSFTLIGNSDDHTSSVGKSGGFCIFRGYLVEIESARIKVSNFSCTSFSEYAKLTVASGLAFPIFKSYIAKAVAIELSEFFSVFRLAQLVRTRRKIYLLRTRNAPTVLVVLLLYYHITCNQGPSPTICTRADPVEELPQSVVTFSRWPNGHAGTGLRC